MTYVEWLRVRNVLRVVAIVLGACIVICGILRVSIVRDETYEALIAHVQLDPGTKIVHTTLPDGTPRVTMSDPNGTLVVIDDHGYSGKHIEITQPSHERTHERVIIGSVRVFTSENGKTATTVVDTNETMPVLFLMGFADVIALIVATILGAPFARENDGHLEIALTKPFSRTAYALGAMGADAVGIIASSFMTIVTAVIIQSMFELPRLDFSGVNTLAVIMGIVLPLTWYAMLVAATASLRRTYGAILGLAWPIAGLVVLFAVIPWGNSIVGTAIHDIFWLISRINPLTYVNLSISRGVAHGETTIGDPTFAVRIAIESVLLITYGALAVLQWRRVEA